jgi:hypothetical protein
MVAIQNSGDVYKVVFITLAKVQEVGNPELAWLRDVEGLGSFSAAQWDSQ